MDGGAFNPVPIAPTYRDGTDLTVAVSLNGPPSKQESGAHISEQVEEATGFSARLWRRHSVRREKGERAEEHGWDLSFVVSQSIDAMQGVISRQRLATNPPDVLIEIPRNACGMLEFDRASELISLGHDLARERVAGL